MGLLFLIFILVPAIELALLIEIGARIGVVATLAIIAITGIAGAALARAQGISVLRRVQEEMAEGRLPAESILDGVLILLAAALLITPGVLTDCVGLLCLFPPTRRLVRRLLWAWLRRSLERGVASGRVQFHVGVGGAERERGREPPVEPESWRDVTDEPPDRHTPPPVE